VAQALTNQKKQQRVFKSSQHLPIKALDKMAYLQSMSKMIEAL